MPDTHRLPSTTQGAPLCASSLAPLSVSPSAAYRWCSPLRSMPSRCQRVPHISPTDAAELLSCEWREEGATIRGYVLVGPFRGYPNDQLCVSIETHFDGRVRVEFVSHGYVVRADWVKSVEEGKALVRRVLEEKAGPACEVAA